MERKEQNSLLTLGRVAPVQDDHKKRKFLKGIAIAFLVFAPFLGTCELFGGGNPPAAKKGDTMTTAKNTGLSQTQNPATGAPLSAKT